MIPNKFNRMGVRKASNNFASDSTVMEFTITDAYKTVSLYSVTCDSIDWGDGTEDSLSSHTYTDNGVYTVEIKGNTALQVNNSDTGNYTLTKVLHLSDYFTSAYRMFYVCNNLTEINCTDWNTSNITNFGFFVYGCTSLTTLDVSNWDISNAVDLGIFVAFCTSLTTLDVSNWDTSSVLSFFEFARNCSSLTILDLSSWVIQESATLTNIAYACTSITEAYAIDQTTCDRLNATSKPSTWEFVLKPTQETE